MLTLSPRLMACARLVSGAGCCCDVGTDHACLPVYLLQRGICTSVIASDIGEGPLQSARQTAARWGVSEGIRIIRSDGLQQIPKEGVTDVVIAGMGAETICDILEHGDWLRRGTNLILQSMTRTPLLRRWLSAHGFALYREIPVQEEQRLYTVLQAGYTGFSHGLEPGKVDHCVNVMGGKDLLHARQIQHIRPVKGDGLAGDLLDAVDAFFLGIEQIVHDDDFIAAFQQLHAAVAADKAGTAGY